MEGRKQEMKVIRKCSLFIIVIAGWVILSIFGFAGRNTIYKEYVIDAKSTPYFAVVFQGAHDHIYPWNLWVKTAKEKDLAKMENENSVEPATEEGKEEKPALPPIREFEQVDDSYFDDAVFIGDSRTVGLRDYGNIDNATFYATIGMNIYDLWDDAFCEVNGQKVTLETALSTQHFGKIYFQIGINEMGRGTIDGFMERYEQTVQKFRELQPDAIIFVQGIMRVTGEKSNSDPIFNNTGINERNERIAALADNRTIFYIDVNDVVCDENGDLQADLSFDNLHLYGSKYGIWHDFLLTKGIRQEGKDS